jgi:hypothetical protein
MNGSRFKTLNIGIVTLAVCLGLAGCSQPGPAQSAGEKVDRAADKVSDTVNPKGPAEKAGRSIDRAVNN